MAWFECNPPKIKKLRKFREFRVALQWSINEALGFLCSFWGEVAELNESGEISDWTPDYLAELTDLGKIDPQRVWKTLVATEWIDAKEDGRAFVRDWIDIAGSYLVRKYHNSDRQKLVQFWGLYGRMYGREQKPEKDTKGSAKEDGESGAAPQGSNQEVKTFPAGNGEERVRFPSPRLSPSLPKSRGLFINPSGSGAATPDAKVRPEIAILIKSFRDKQIEKLSEPPAKFNYGLAGNGFKKLLQSNPPYSPEEIEIRFDAYFESTKTFIVQRSHCIDDFFTYFNKLKDGPIANQVGSYDKQPFNDGAATVY